MIKTRFWIIAWADDEPEVFAVARAALRSIDRHRGQRRSRGESDRGELPAPSVAVPVVDAVANC